MATVRIIWTEANSAVVNITTATGAAATNFTVGGAGIGFPYTLTGSTSFDTTALDTYTISVQLFGYEIAGNGTTRTAVLNEPASNLIFAPTPPVGVSTEAASDADISGLINTPGSATATKLSATYALNQDQTLHIANWNAAANTIHTGDSTATALVATLPTAPPDRTRVVVKDLAAPPAGSPPPLGITLACGGSDVINKPGGGTTLLLRVSNQAMTVQYDATRSVWVVISDDIPLGSLDKRYALTDPLGQALPRTLARKGAHPGIISLCTGTEDETWGVVSCTQAVDTTNYVFGGQGLQQTVSGAQTNAALSQTPVSPSTSGVTPILPAQAVCAWVYVPDASKITNLQVELAQDSGNTILWNRANTSGTTAEQQPLSNGWNFLRWKMCEGLGTWAGTTLNRVRLLMTTTAATSVTWGHVYLETPPKARMIYIADRGYKSFVVNGLPLLRAAGIPVTWALDIQQLGAHAGEYPSGAQPYAEVITASDVAGYAALGDSISFHGFSSNPTATMTAAQLRADTLAAQKWLQAGGYLGRVWRAAYVQNTAAAHAAINDYVIGQRTWDVSTFSVPQDIWPPRDMQNIATWSFYDKTEPSSADCPTTFDILRRTHGLLVVYNHGVGTGYVNDATQAQFNEFVAAAQAGIQAGWLEATTFEALFTESGGTFESMGGALVARYTNPDGTPVVKNIL